MAVATKSVALPNVPTVRELGFPNLELQGWNGFLAPKGTPEPVIARLQQEIAAAVQASRRAQAHDRRRRRAVRLDARPRCATMLRQQVAQVRPVVEELKLSWNRRRRRAESVHRWPRLFAFLGMLLISLVVALLAALQLGDFFGANDEFMLVIAGVAAFAIVAMAVFAVAYARGAAAERSTASRCCWRSPPGADRWRCRD